MTDFSAIQSFCGLCVVLLIGKFLRYHVGFLQRLFLPSSVIGGLVALGVLRLLSLSDSADDYVTKQWTVGWNKLAGFLINIVFASLFVGVKVPKPSVVWKKSGPQLMYGMVLAWGQWLVACVVTLCLLVPIFDVNKLFATVLPVGFAGGHGTAAGLTDTYETLDWPEGKDFGLAAATIGLVLSIMLGVLWVNVAVWKGWIVKDKMENSAVSKLSIRGVYAVDDRPPAGVQTVKADSIDTLALHLAILGLAVLIGYGFKRALIAFEHVSSSLEDLGFFSGFPLFPLAMAGGIIVQLCLERMGENARIVDARLMERLSGTSLDFLITGAVASVDLSSLQNDMAPFFILLASGIIWHFACLYFLGPRLLPNHWFERAIAELGMSMGVIASGLVLLRTVDPESSTPVPADFAFKQLLHSPFMGGGLWTAIALPLTDKAGLWVTTMISGVVFVLWLVVYRFYFRPRYQPGCHCKACGDKGLDGSSGSLDTSLLPMGSSSDALEGQFHEYDEKDQTGARNRARSGSTALGVEDEAVDALGLSVGDNPGQIV